MKLPFSLVAVVALAVTAQGQVLYDFNDVDQLDDFNATGQNLNMFTWESTGGLNNSGNLDASRAAQGVGQLVQKASFSGDTPSFTLSIYFQHSDTDIASNTSYLLFLGIGPNATYSTHQNTDHLRVGLTGLYNSTTETHSYRLDVQNSLNGSTTNNNGPNTFALTPDDWYFMSGEVTLVGQTYTVNLELWESTNTGALVGATPMQTHSAVFTNANLANDPSVHAFLGASSSAERRGLQRVDNFTSPIPEPSSTFLLGLGALLLMRRSRLRRPL